MNAGLSIAVCLVLTCASAAAAAAESEAPATSAAYEDRLIEGGALPADVFVGTQSADSNGWSRSFRLDAITSRVSRGDVDQDESGLRLNAMLDTPNYGAITLDANVRTSRGQAFGSDTGNLITVYQLGLPLEGGWRLNNALGVTTTPGLDLARQQQRFWIPTILQNGLATEMRSSGGVQIHASVGKPGLLTGLYVPTFEDLGGEQVSAGAQWSGTNGWSAGFQGVGVNDVQLGIGPLNSSRTISGRSGMAAVAWGNSRAHLQFNAAGSTQEGGGEGVGAWIDAAIHGGAILHTFGIFRFDPELYWGNQSLMSNHEGGYYRAAFQSRRWTLDGGVDYVQTVAGQSHATTFGTAYARYQLSGRTGFGGGLNVLSNDTDAWSTFGFIDQVNRLGIGRLQLDYATDELRERTQLTLSQTWNTQPGRRLGNTIIAGRESTLGHTRNLLGIAVNGGGDLRGNLSADLNARWDVVSGDETSNNVLVNFALNWMIAPGWSLGANYYLSRNAWRTPLNVDSPIDNAPIFQDSRTNDRGYYITLRRDWQAGTRFVPLGGAAGSGSGNIEGFLYFDQNENSLMDAGEAGAANIVILLDGRFAARTNADGRFEFQSVGAGAHEISVAMDNLPLPWTVKDDGRTSVTVNVRQRSFVAIGATRMR